MLQSVVSTAMASNAGANDQILAISATQHTAADVLQLHKQH